MQERARILVVDDSPMNVAIVEEMLGSTYELLCTDSGEKALAVARSFRPDLVLLDIMMPGIGGYETCRRLREDPDLRYVKIILLSAKADVADRLKGYELGADDYITKPFNSDEFLAKIGVFLRLKNVEELDQFKMDILRLINHETRTPLNGILGSLELLLDPGEAAQSIDRELLRMALTSGRNLVQLFEKGLLFCELRSGRFVFDPRVVDLAGLAANVRQHLAALAERNETRIAVSVPEPVSVLSDIDCLAQVGEILVHHAIRRSPAGAEVRIEVRRDGDSGVLAVHHRGPGYSADYLPHVFDAFVPQDIMHQTESDGLSLAIVRELVERQRGSIRVTSDAGEGACFELRLPLQTVSESSGSAPAPLTSANV